MEFNQMKKHTRIFLALLSVLLLFTLVGCGGTKVVFDIGDATLVSGELTQKYKDGVEIIPPEITKDGYALMGWDGDYKTPTQATTVKPIWKKLYSVQFDLAGGVTDNDALLTQQIIDGNAATAPAVTKDGFSFEGWNTDFSAVTSDLTVIAQWKALYTVTFDTNGGKAEDETLLVQTVKEGEAAALPIVTREKYNFKGWDTDVSSVTGNVTVKANWERKVYSATEIFKEINPGTVEINTYRLNDFHFSTGSGFFIDENGTVVTNYHVIENARKIVVTMHDKTEYEVTKVISYDKELDIAILSINTKGKKVPYLELADKLPVVGDAAYAIGSSLGLTGTFSSGIVSYVNRTVKDAENVKFIQTTTPISSGNSGGPLVNENGLVIGINSASYTEGQNLNLAVEISQLKQLKEVNLTPEQVFQKEGTLKYFFGEKIVKEDTIFSTFGQPISNGDTVHGSISSAKDQDYYFTALPKEEAALLVMIKLDSLDDVKKLLVAPIVSKSSVVATAQPVGEDHYMLTVQQDDDGSYYCIIAVVIDQTILRSYSYVGMAIFGTDAVDYEMFMYLMSAEDIEGFLS